ncbi:MAG TPA: response regulator [Vicinamibacterales bacterium]|jgi:CheY-like chemotaxis protein/anti-sigma regulatory factor (Ser/Thr protein kinase)|nr:response regulator [Vicinamibacterales bacterium]
MNKILVVDDDTTTRFVLRTVLTNAGFSTAVAGDGVEALEALGSERFDLLLLDVWMPRMNGLELLAKLRTIEAPPRVVVMTSDDAPETLLKAVREQAFKYVHKPVEADQLLQTVHEALAAADVPSVEVISARPEWVELVVPCTRDAAGHIGSVMSHLDAALAPDVRESIAYAFRELLLNAVEWGGKLDSSRTVRIACLRAKRMVMYRIADPGQGFNIEDLPHAAVGQPPDDPIAHMHVREAKGIRPGGFGLLMVRASVDELLYNEQRNEVVFVKYLDDDSAER